MNFIAESLLLGTPCCGADFGERSCPRGHELRCENPALIAAPTPLWNMYCVICPAFIIFCIRHFQFYRNFCFVSASARDGLKGSLAKFGFSAGFVRFANVPESEAVECVGFIIILLLSVLLPCQSLIHNLHLVLPWIFQILQMPVSWQCQPISNQHFSKPNNR